MDYCFKTCIIYLGYLAVSCLLLACNSGVGAKQLESVQIKSESMLVARTIKNKAQNNLRFKLIAPSIDAFCAITDNDQIYCWGNGSSGQLGNGSSSDQYFPAAVITAESKHFKTLKGFNHTFCALDYDGIAYCWGNGSSGQLGNGTYKNIDSLTQVTMPATTFISIMVSSNIVCAIGANKHIYCWGAGTEGQIGNNQNNNQSVPTEVTMPDNNEYFTELNSSYYTPATICGLTNLGNIYCWGYGASGAIGNGSYQNTNTPAKVLMPDGVTFAHLISGMGNNTCALDIRGNLYCWGYNGHGENANGTYTTINYPKPAIMPEGKSFQNAATSVNTGCAITTDFLAYCWGYNAEGELGNGQNITSPVPVAVSIEQKLTKIATGFYMKSTFCGINTESQILCWGYGESGNIGDGLNSNESIPALIEISEPHHNFIDLQVSGNNHTVCALDDKGQAYCWGYGLEGQLGNGIKINSSKPSLVITHPAITKLIASSGFYASTFCAIHSNAKVYCWGYGLDGEIGNGQNKSVAEPSLVSIPENQLISDIAATDNSICALDQNGQAFCWGYGLDGQLGNGTNQSSNLPVRVKMPYPGSSFSKLIASSSTFCALDKKGGIYCWGYGLNGEIGSGKFASESTPVQAGIITFSDLITSSSNTFCAVATVTNDLYCWGNGTYGEIGNGQIGNANKPTKISGNYKFNFLVAASQTLCGINSNYHGYCWGAGNYGQIGDGALSIRNTPTELLNLYGMAPLLSIAATDSSFCAIDINSHIFCWGMGSFGQMGNGSNDYLQNNSIPGLVPLSDDKIFVSLAASSNNFCAMTDTAQVYCWGDNEFGQIGSGIDYKATNTPATISMNNQTFANDIAKNISLTPSSDGFCLLNDSGHVYCWGFGLNGEIGNSSNNNSNFPTPLAFSY